MTISDYLEKPFETKPFYAVAGLVDASVEQVRKVSKMERENLANIKVSPAEVRKDFTDAISTVSTELSALPQRAQTLADDMTSRVEGTYDELVIRGRTVVRRVRRQAATQHMTDQAKTTVRKTRKAATTAKEAGTATTRSARSTTRTARKGAASTATAGKAAATSAAATAERAVDAVEAAAEKIGD